MSRIIYVMAFLFGLVGTLVTSCGLDRDEQPAAVAAPSQCDSECSCSACECADGKDCFCQACACTPKPPEPEPPNDGGEGDDGGCTDSCPAP